MESYASSIPARAWVSRFVLYWHIDPIARWIALDPGGIYATIWNNIKDIGQARYKALGD